MSGVKISVARNTACFDNNEAEKRVHLPEYVATRSITLADRPPLRCIVCLRSFVNDMVHLVKPSAVLLRPRPVYPTVPGATWQSKPEGKME